MPIPHFTPSKTFPAATSLFYPMYTVTTITTAGNVTYTAAQLLGGMIIRQGNGAARSDTTPTAAQIVAAMNGADPGNGFDFSLRNTSATAVAITLVAGTGVTLIGTAAVAQNNNAVFRCIVNSDVAGSEAVTIYNQGAAAF